MSVEGTKVSREVDDLLARAVMALADRHGSKRKRSPRECAECGKPWSTIAQARRCCTAYGYAAATILSYAFDSGGGAGHGSVSRATYAKLRDMLDSPTPDIVQRVLDAWGADQMAVYMLMVDLVREVDPTSDILQNKRLPVSLVEDMGEVSC